MDSQPLLSGVPLVNEKYHIVFVFPNFYQTDLNPKHYLNKLINIAEARSLYNRIFKILVKSTQTQWKMASALNQHGETITYEQRKRRVFDAKWSQLDGSGQTILSYMEFIKFIVECLVDIFENVLNMEVVLFYSRDRDEIFMKIRASETNYEVQADIVDYPLQLTRRNMEPKQTFREVMPYASFERKPEQVQVALLSYYVAPDAEFQYKRYYEEDDGLVKNGDLQGTSYFRYKDKARLLRGMISGVVDVNVLLNEKVLLDYYWVHNGTQLKQLRQRWASIIALFQRQNLKFIRIYFGEKIGIYFAWLEYYIQWLFIPAILGVIVFILALIFEDLEDKNPQMTVSEVAILVLSLYLAISSTVMAQIWMRRQNELTWRWGTDKLMDVEFQRANYEGKYEKDPITGRWIKVQQNPGKEKAKRSLVVFVSCLFAAGVLAILVYLLIYRAYLAEQYIYTPAILNALQIKIMNIIYKKVAKFLHDWENYETDQQYMDSLTIKLYLFQFVNGYASLFYIAFAEWYTAEEDKRDWMNELAIQLACILLISFLFNLVELGYPWLRSKIKILWENYRIRRLQRQGHTEVRTNISYLEYQSKLDDYETPLDDYMELVIDYGYIVMFSPAFPLAPILALLIGILEVRVDAYKLCHLTKRPYPATASNIGVWYYIILTVSYVGAITNTAILLFTTNVFDIEGQQRWVVFLILEHCILLFKFAITSVIEETPSSNLYLDVKNASVWRKRVINERIYNRSNDVDENSLMRNTKFRALPRYNKLILNPHNIYYNNI